MQKFKWEKNHGKFIHEWLWRESLKFVPSLDTIADQLKAKFINVISYDDNGVYIDYVDQNGQNKTTTITHLPQLFDNDGNRVFNVKFLQPDDDTISITTNTLDGKHGKTITLSLTELKKRVTALEQRPTYDLTVTDSESGSVNQRLISMDIQTDMRTLNTHTDKGDLSVPLDNPDNETIDLKDGKLHVSDFYLSDHVDGISMDVNDGKLKINDSYIGSHIDNKTIQINNGKIFAPQKEINTSDLTLIKTVSIDDPSSINLYVTYYPVTSTYFKGDGNGGTQQTGILTEIQNGGGQLTVTKDLPVGVITSGNTDLQLTGSTVFMLQSTTKPSNKYLVQVFSSPSLGLLLYALQTIPADTYKFTDQ